MEQKTITHKNLTYRIKKMNAIEALALRTASDMSDVGSTQVFFTNILERMQVQAGEQWLPVKQPGRNVYLPDKIEDDFDAIKTLVEFFMKEFLTPFLENSVE